MNSLAAEKNKFAGEKTKDTYRFRNGQLCALQNYYRNKIYNDDEREELWTTKLDEQVRYVMGNKIDVSTEEGKYIYDKAAIYWAQRDEEQGNLNSKYIHKKDRKVYKAALKALDNMKCGLNQHELSPAQRLAPFEGAGGARITLEDEVLKYLTTNQLH